MKISELPESPGRDLLMRLEFLDHQPGGAVLYDKYRHARDSSVYYVVLLANYVAEALGDSNSQRVSIPTVAGYFAGLSGKEGP